MTTAINWTRFKQIVDDHQSFLLTSHIRPDCDALGSELGMAKILESVGKKVVIVNGHSTPPNLAFIDPENRIQTINETISIDDLQEIDVLMVLDTSAWAQLGPMGDVLRQTSALKIILDHHVSQDDLGAELFKNTSAEAAGRIVVEAAEALGVALTAEIAKPLFAALATDTGWFRFPSCSEKTFQIGGKLLSAGAVPQDIFTELYEQDTLARLQLRGRIIARSKSELDGRLIYTSVLPEDFAETGALPTDTEDVINLTLGVAGTEVAVIFVALKNRQFKVSFRSRCDVDCSKLAEHFEGGGHKAAAGATIDGPFEEAQQRVLTYVREIMS